MKKPFAYAGGLAASFHELWSLPLQIAVALFLLYRQVEWVCLAGVGFVVLLIPLNRLLAKRIAVASSSLMEAKDERISSMTATLRSIFTLRACVRADLRYRLN